MILALAGCFALMIVPLSAQEPSDTPVVDGPALTNAPATTEGGTNEVDIKELMALPSFTNDTGMVMVKVSESLWAGAYEVTQQEYQKVMGSNPSKFAGGRNPVDSVSWTDAMTFCTKLSEAEAKVKKLPEGFAYTLPTQEQWESFAQQAELKDAVTSEKASRTGTATVGSLTATPPGLYDIRGNVWEWCLDSQNPASRVARGGAWNSWIDINLRRDFRWYGEPTFHNGATGFRCLLLESSARWTPPVADSQPDSQSISTPTTPRTRAGVSPQ